MAPYQLAPRSSVPPVRWGTDGQGIGCTVLDLEARCALYIVERYYWLVDIAPVLVRYQAQQWWRDTKRNVGYLAADLVEAFHEWLG